MKFILPFLCFILSACGGVPPEESGRFKGDRGKVTAKARETKTTRATRVGYPRAKNSGVNTSASENLIFPIKLSAKHTAFHMSSIDHKKVTFSVEPSDQPFTLVSVLSGTVSLTTENGWHKLSLTPSPASGKTFHFELSEEDTTLIASDGVSVSQQDKLASTTAPIIFYVKKQGELDILCLHIQAAQVRVIKNFLDHSDCQ